MIVICFKICMSLKINERISNLQRSMSKIYYMSPKIHGTEKYSHGFLEISGSDYIIVSRIFGDIWKINVSKNPWEYISVPRISWISRIFGDIPIFFVKSNEIGRGISPKIREIHEIRGTEIYSHGFLETYIFQISPKIRETII